MYLKNKILFSMLRMHHYIKNLVILLPIFFAGRITDLSLLGISIWAAAAFSLNASAVYILNDWLDIEEDKKHPQKRYRSLATGAVSKKTAVCLIVIFFFVGLSLMAVLSTKALKIMAVYIALNIAYSFYLKHIAILDVAIIAAGFVLRLFIGSAVTGVPLSIWIIIMTFLLAMFIALAKRRNDMILFVNTGERMRKAVDGYNLQYIDRAMTVMASVVIVTYILYTTSNDAAFGLKSEYLYSTALFVVIGVLRFLQITLVKQESGSPLKILFQDNFMKINVLSWACLFVWIIYL